MEVQNLSKNIVAVTSNKTTFYKGLNCGVGEVVPIWNGGIDSSFEQAYIFEVVTIFYQKVYDAKRQLGADNLEIIDYIKLPDTIADKLFKFSFDDDSREKLYNLINNNLATFEPYKSNK